MAVVRARSAPPYGVILFAALWVVSTAAAVLFALQWSSASTRADDLANTVNKNNVTNSSSMETANNLKKAVVGEQAAELKDLQGQITQAVHQAGRPENESLLAAFQAVTADRDARAKALAEESKAVEKMTAEINQTNKQYEDRVTAIQKDAASLRDQLAKANEEAAKNATGRDDAVKAGQEELNKKVAELEDLRRSFVLQAQELKGTIGQRDAQIAELKKRLEGQVKSGAVATGQPDGQVIHVNSPDGEVYINLTKSRDRITPGLTFTVYDKDTGVRYETIEEAEGKGAIEVIQPGEVSSLCRIIHRVNGKSIQAGDVISNIVYHNDKTRKTRFVIVGDFDLDGDGVATSEERNRLIRQVTSWGGIVDDHVTTLTDYAVFGERPVGSTVAASTEPTAGSTADERNRQQGLYDETAAEAKRLGIPTLNANRFYAMIGYYSTTIARY